MYKKLPVELRKKVKLAIVDLQKESFPSYLKVHKLSGKLSKYYSCSVDIVIG